MKIKALSLGLAITAALTLSSCSHESVPDDVRKISQDEAKKGINAQTAPDTKPSIQPSMGAGIVSDAPASPVAPIDNGTIIIVPTTKEVELSKNEKVKLYAGQLKPGTVVKAVLFYSSGGQNDKTLSLGEETVTARGEIKEEVTIPANLATGSYMISLDVNGSLYTAPIKVK